VSHVGKIYNVLSHLLATEIHERVQGVQEAIVWLCSRIGKPIDQPEVISVQVRLKPGSGLSGVTDAIRQIIDARLARMAVFCQELANGVYPVC
jgi:S-adenosylmethionine synthetase